MELHGVCVGGNRADEDSRIKWDALAELKLRSSFIPTRHDSW